MVDRGVYSQMIFNTKANGSNIIITTDANRVGAGMIPVIDDPINLAFAREKGIVTDVFIPDKHLWVKIHTPIMVEDDGKIVCMGTLWGL
jgi:hypothetical protein